MLLLLFLCLLPAAHSWHVLFINTYAGGSHQTVSGYLANMFIRNGHEVTYLSTNPPGYLDSRVDVQRIPTVEKKGNDMLKHMLATPSLMETIKGAFTLFSLCGEFVKEPTVQEMRKSGKGKFDISIIFGMPIADECAMALSHELGVPTTAYQFPVGAFLPHTRYNLGLPIYASSVYLEGGVNPCHSFGSSPTTVWARSKNLFVSLFAYGVEWTARKVFDTGVESFPDYPGISAVQRQLSLLFLHHHPIADYPMPKPEGVLSLGGMLCPPFDESQLSEELREFTSRPFVLFILGSHVENLPREVEVMLTTAFSRLPFNVIWKTKSTVPDLPGNVRTFSWLPQMNLLQHPNIQVFITHGGYASKMEGLCAGVPMLVAPQFAPDQYTHAVQLTERGLGLAILKLAESTAEEIFEKVMALSAPEFQVRLDKESRMILSTRMTDEQVLGYVDMAVSGHKLLPGYQPWYQYLYLDIILLPLFTIYLVREAVRRIRGTD